MGECAPDVHVPLESRLLGKPGWEGFSRLTPEGHILLHIVPIHLDLSASVLNVIFPHPLNSCHVMSSPNQEHQSHSCIIHERVLAEWKTPGTDELRSLGSLSLRNKGSSFTLTAVHDKPQTKVLVRLSVDIKLRISGQPHEKSFHIDIPSTSGLVINSDTRRIQDMGLSAAVTHDAGLSASGQVIQATFSLEKPVDLVIPQLKTAIRLASRPAQGLLDLFTSLSSSLCFTLYIRPSNYAREGLKRVCN